MAASTDKVMKPVKNTGYNSYHQYPNPARQMPIELADWEPVQSIGFKEKFKKKALENPFVPIGIFATTCALSIGLYSFRKGQVQRSQMMMRARVAAQAFTIGAVLVGVALQARKGNKPKDQ